MKSKDAERKLKKNPNCSFCGVHKDDVPLMIVSNVTNATVCSVCALAVIQQTFHRMMGMERLIRQAQTPTPPSKVIVTGESKKDAAIEKVTAEG